MDSFTNIISTLVAEIFPAPSMSGVEEVESAVPVNEGEGSSGGKCTIA